MNNYDEILKDIERRADAIGYDLDNDEGYTDICSVLTEAEFDGRELDEDETESVEMEFERLEMVLARKKRR